jgi:hypothetical protein
MTHKAQQCCMNTSQQQQLSDWPTGIVTHARSACHVIRPAGTTDGFPTVRQSKRLVGRPHHTREFCLSVFKCTGGSEGETVRVWGTLEAVTRERPVKTQQAGKDLACAVVICESWRLAVALVVPNHVYKWSINPLSNPRVSSHNVTVFIRNRL